MVTRRSQAHDLTDTVAPAAAGVEPLRSRLRPAEPYVRLVLRDALVGALLACRTPLVVVSAPAGYGKSTVLSQWAAAERRPTAWLQLDAADNDPVVLLTYLIAALDEIAPLEPGVAELPCSQPLRAGPPGCTSRSSPTRGARATPGSSAYVAIVMRSPPILSPRCSSASRPRSRSSWCARRSSGR